MIISVLFASTYSFLGNLKKDKMVWHTSSVAPDFIFDCKMHHFFMLTPIRCTKFKCSIYPMNLLLNKLSSTFLYKRKFD